MMPGLLDRLKLQGEAVDESGKRLGGSGFRHHSVDPQEAVPVVQAPKGLDALGAVHLLRQRLLGERPELLEETPASGALRDQLRRAIADIICRDNIVVEGLTREALADVAVREMAGLGPIEPLLCDPQVTDVMINGPDEVWVEREGQVQRSDTRFRDEVHLRDTVARLLAPLGRRLDNLSPFVDARLPDGSRLNVVIPPITRHGYVATIRRFRQEPLGLDQLVDLGLLSADTAALLRAAVRGRLNLLVSGGAGSGKTTLLNALCSVVSTHERIITIEDAAELRLFGVHTVSLEARPPNVEGLGEITIRQLLRNALRMRPDRLVIGEIRDASAFEFLQAINTGHAGSMCTIHANTARDALYRLENLTLMAAGNVVLAAIRGQIASALDLVIHLARSGDGLRHLAELGVVGPPGAEGERVLLTLVPSPPGDGGKAVESLAQRAIRRCGQTRALEILGAAKALLGRREQVGA